MSDTDIGPDKNFLGSVEAHKIARCVRGCATDDQYVELLWRIDKERERLRAGRAADPEAVEAAKRIERERYVGKGSQFVRDTRTVARAFLASAAGRAAMWAECREACAKELEEESGKATIPANKVTLLTAAHICRALEVPNE